MMIRLNCPVEIAKAPLERGVYRIFWIKDGIPQPIMRIGGIDNTGLLYIGHTQITLRARLNQFRRSAFINSTNHTAGRKYRLNKMLTNLIAEDELFAEIVNYKHSYDMENEELRTYAYTYGEVPPLNG